MAGFVLDVSACMPWCCEDEATTASEALLQRAARREQLHVPSLWPCEMMNAVAVSVRRQRVTTERAHQFFGPLAVFDFRIAPTPAFSDFAALYMLASRHQLTAYDASYPGLARQLALPLATLDDDLREAALAEVIATLLKTVVLLPPTADLGLIALYTGRRPSPTPSCRGL